MRGSQFDSPFPPAYCAAVLPDGRCDVVIIGAGPAGSTAAQLLASWGLSVVLSDAALARGSEVRSAFDQLRAAAHVRLRAADAVRFEPAAIIEGREVVMRNALIVAGVDAPLQFAAGVNLPALVRLAAACGEVPALIEAYQAQVGRVPLTGLLTGLSLLVARRALVADNSDPGSRNAD